MSDTPGASHRHGFQCPETEAHAETPVFDAAMRDHGMVHFPRPLGTLTPARIEPLPPLTVASVRDQYESQRAAGFAQGGASE